MSYSHWDATRKHYSAEKGYIESILLYISFFAHIVGVEYKANCVWSHTLNTARSLGHCSALQSRLNEVSSKNGFCHLLSTVQTVDKNGYIANLHIIAVPSMHNYPLYICVPTPGGGGHGTMGLLAWHAWGSLVSHCKKLFSCVRHVVHSEN